MNLEIKKLVLHNFFSFEHQEIVFNQNGFISVVGENNNNSDNSKSNGSGKSSLWEAIIWVLTGNTMREIKNPTRNCENDGCWVGITMDIDNDEWKIMRSRSHEIYKTDLKIYKNGEDKSGKGIRESEKLLEQYLPQLNEQLLSSVIILGQGLPNRLSNNTPSGRKEVLEKLTDSDFMIEDLKVRVAKRLSAINQKIEEKNNKCLSLSFAETNHKKQIEKLQNQLENMNTRDFLLTDIENIKKKITELENALDNEKNNNKKINNLLDEESKLYNKNFEEYSAKMKVVKEYKSKNNYSEFVDQYNDVRAQIISLQKQIEQIENMSDVCPTCGQKITLNINRDTTELHKQLDECVEHRNVLQNKIDKLDEEVELLSGNAYRLFSDYQEKSFNKTRELKEDKEKSNELIEECNTKLWQLKNDLGITQTTLENYDTNVSNIHKEIEENKQKILIVEKEKQEVSDALVDLRNRKEVLTIMETTLKRDFRGYLLCNIIDYINQEAKRLCKIVFKNEKIKFWLEGNNLIIEYDNKQYECLSGGEKQKVDIIVQLSIRQLLCTYTNFNCNILVLDELFDGLDKTGCESIINLIMSELNDVKSIYIITHHKDLNIPYDSQLFVIKDEKGVSRIANIL